MLTATAVTPALRPPVLPEHAVPQLAIELFEHLAPLHGLDPRHAATAERAAFGLPCIRAFDVWGSCSRVLFYVGLDDNDPEGGIVAEAAAWYACDLAPDPAMWEMLDSASQARVMWIAAVLRVAEAVVLAARGAVSGVHVAWTDTVLHLEFDGVDPTRDVARAINHAAALEMVTGRQVLLTSSVRRRSWFAA
ncbi:MAG: hypothetical protein U1E26_01095 [Coriobacteriia bacterium]|nr:hypothetical protein [Coriobacteriia bacterium]